jgi:hypothetical protein
VFDCNTSLVFNIIRHNMMSQTEIEILRNTEKWKHIERNTCVCVNL